MKKNLKNNWITILMIVLSMLSSCNSQDNHEHDRYTCPMHPTVESDRPASCPVCGMDLVRKTKNGEASIDADVIRLIKSPDENIISNIRTIRGSYDSGQTEIHIQGRIVYDTRKLFAISSRIGGRLENVYLKYDFQRVVKGQKIAEIYSPELITAQREFLSAVTNNSIMSNARERLTVLGMSTQQIESLSKTQKVQSTFPVFSNYTGYLAGASNTRTSSEPSVPPMGNGMNPATSKNETTIANSISEGSYISSGQVLFTIAGDHSLRVELDVGGSQLQSVIPGQIIHLEFGNGITQQSTIDFIQPFSNQGQEFIRIRAEIHPTAGLHVGHLVKATINRITVPSLWVPREAVLHLGEDNVVFIKTKDVLKPRSVVIGTTSSNQIEIKEGLASTEEIAANAQFLIDSESSVSIER